MATTFHRPRLPACQNCSQKKVKCDSSRPRCHWCARNKVDCLIFDSVGQQLLSRSYLHELECSAAELLAASPTDTTASSAARQRDSRPSPHRARASDEPPNDDGPSESTQGHTPRGRFSRPFPPTARGGSLSFVALLLSDADWRRSNEDLLRTLTRAPKAPSTVVEACDLPSGAVAKELFERYLNWSHILAPFLLRRGVWQLHERVFAEPAPARPPDGHELFRTFILCAIAAVIPHRNGQHPQHPEAYYRAALQHLDSRFLTRGLASIQDLLLICRFGVYHYIGISIWDVVRLCMRMCVEQGLHSGDGEDPIDPLLSQVRRRVFWQVYLMDRYSSTTLDRPFAIDDRDVEVGFPADANDEDVALLGLGPAIAYPLSTRGAAAAAVPSETTVFLFCVRLRQVSSRIHKEFSRLQQDATVHAQPHLAAGRICTTLNRLLQDLRAWRASAPPMPTTAAPNSPTAQRRRPLCLYESHEWFDLLHAREKLALVRRAVDLLPKAGGAPPAHVLSLFSRTALETIEIYAALLQRRNLVAPTRSYFHLMFTAGLSVMYCLAASASASGGVHADAHEDWPGRLRESPATANPGLGQDAARVTRGLSACEEALVAMSEQLPSASVYTTVFGALRRHVTRRLRLALPQDSNPAAVGTSGAGERNRRHQHPNQSSGPTSLSTSTVSPGPCAPPAAAPFGPRLGQEAHYQRPSYTDDGNPGYNGYNWAQNSAQQTAPGPLGLRFDLLNPSTGGAVPPGPRPSLVTAQAQQRPEDGILQWALTNDESIWTMDLLLGEYVYGDPSHGGLFGPADI